MGVLVTLIGVIILRLSPIVAIVVGALEAHSVYVAGAGVFSVTLNFAIYALTSGVILAVIGFLICALGAMIIGSTKFKG